MAYTHHENLGGFGSERQVSILTTANVLAAIVGGLLLWQLTRLLALGGAPFSAGWLLQGVLILMGGGAGILLTVRWGGLALLDRLTLLLGYHSRRLMGATLIRPSAPLISAQAPRIPTIVRDGRALVQPYIAGAVEEAEHV